MKNKKLRNISLLVLLIVLLFGCIFMLKKSDIINGNLSDDAVIGMLPGTSREEIMNELQKEVDASQFKFKINSDITIKDNIMNLELQNPPSNFYNMKLELKILNTNEIIYKSNIIKPNQYIKDAKIKKELNKKGQYDAIAYLTAYNPKTKQIEGKVEVDVKLNII
ncbi:hypothetical protein [Clostridium perfringens]|uniref:hypothetical protein n=1 Tax=Clostridium perfringens TaxID=1502 RepID=UPI001A2AA091|nr:hypothetical protein [Clostridium perfringens]HAT4318879.1 hypothetical protein [Clostridium perfringens]